MVDPTILGTLLLEARLRHENRPERVPIEHVWECLIEELERAGRQVLQEATIGGYIDPRLLVDSLQKQRDRALEVQHEAWQEAETRRALSQPMAALDLVRVMGWIRP